MAGDLSNEGGIGNIRFLKNCMGTWLVQELRRAWRIHDGREMEWEELNRLTEAGTPFAAFMDPDDPGFYNPQNMEAAIVEYCRRTGQRPPADRGSMLSDRLRKPRAEVPRGGRADRTRSAVYRTKSSTSWAEDRRNAFLNQLTANACGMKVIAGPEEATAVGNAMVQGMALGAIKKLTDAKGH